MAKGKTLSTVISLAGKVDGSLLKALNKSKTQTASAAKAMSKSMSDSTKVASQAMGKSIKSVATGALKIFGVLKAITKLKDYARETVTAAKAQLEVQTKLSSVLENVKSIQIRGPNAAANAAKELNKVADSLEAVGVIGNDVTVAGMQQLATYQLSDKQISVLSAGMDDLLAQQKGLNASQSDAVSIGNMIGKAMTGNVGALSKVGITFTKAQAEAIKTGDATLRAATIAEVLKDNVGGVNKAMAQTDQGQLVQAQNTFDAIKEEIGYFLLPLMNQFVKGVLPYATKGLDALTGVLDKAGPIISSGIAKGFQYLSTIMPGIMQILGKVIPIVMQLFSSLNMGKELLPIIISSIQMLIPVFQAILPQITDMMSNIMPVIISLIKNLVPFIADLISQIAPLVTSLMSALIPAFLSLIPPITKIIKAILPVLISLFRLIVPFISNLITQIAPLVVILVEALLPAFMLIIPPIMKLVQSLLPVLKTLFGAVFSLLRALAPVITVVAQIFSAYLGAAITTLTPVIKGIVNHFTNIIDVLSNIINFIVNVFTGNWSAAWENVKNIFAGIFTSFLTVAKTPLNLVIELVNSAINGINGLTSVINKIPGVEIGKIPQIPYLAKGATVSSPTLAMIGEGKVPETVVPHNNTPRSRALLAEAANGVGIKNDSFSSLPVIDRMMDCLSYFAENVAKKPKRKSTSNPPETVNNNGKTYNIYFNPVVNAKDSNGVKEALEDEYEKFKSFMKQFMDEEEREVFA